LYAFLPWAVSPRGGRPRLGRPLPNCGGTPFLERWFDKKKRAAYTPNVGYFNPRLKDGLAALGGGRRVGFLRGGASPQA
jgi:hypothetical protein